MKTFCVCAHAWIVLGSIMTNKHVQRKELESFYQGYELGWFIVLTLSQNWALLYNKLGAENTKRCAKLSLLSPSIQMVAYKLVLFLSLRDISTPSLHAKLSNFVPLKVCTCENSTLRKQGFKSNCHTRSLHREILHFTPFTVRSDLKESNQLTICIVRL